MRCAALLVLLALAQEAKNAVPPEDSQRAAEKTVRAAHKDEIGDPKLGRRLLDQAVDTKDDLALRFVLFREACEAATRAGDLETLLRGIDEVHGGFHVVGLSLKEPYLLKMEPALSKPDDLKRLAEVLVRLAQEAVDLDQYDVAGKAAQSSQSSARKAKDAALAARADAAGKSVNEMKAAFEKARKAEELLASAPDDANANLVWGEWLCFQKGRWDRGLGFLTKAPNSPVRTMALKEFSGSAELNSLMELADGWWDLAEREPRPSRRVQLLVHARSIYTAALSKSSGEIRAKIGKRLEFDPTPPARK
ncbi:MAG TPA: hypothetical protein VNM14_18675 [Planctomycetota bacterium]|nr:hypothetical protein [Planctomycetota bacterium]